MIIYNIETYNKANLTDIFALAIHEQLEEGMAEWFLLEAEQAKYKADILSIGKTFLQVECKDSVESCLYCENLLETKGLFCDTICEELHNEEDGNFSSLPF